MRCACHVLVAAVLVCVGSAAAQTPYYGHYTIQIPVNESWMDTLIDLVPGDHIIIVARGTAAASGVVDGVQQWFGPDGVGDNCQDPYKPFPGALNMLIGRIGEEGDMFAVGSFRGIAVDSPGRLYLGMNDGYPGDATGFFVAVIYRVLPVDIGGVESDFTHRDRPGISTYPNPFQSATSILLNVPNHESYEVMITDLQGRLVRAFPTISPGSQPVHWDGRNDSGRKVSSGIYFVRARSESGAAYERRITLTR